MTKSNLEKFHAGDVVTLSQHEYPLYSDPIFMESKTEEVITIQIVNKKVSAKDEQKS
ncbi:hypothetical protein [Lentilactobacillus kosonis]|uniref:Uncharacterized protein n=1 Tax=Lentilactobacillus kosonis TaxID=2810561 RepID=A0A401FPE2_9LACO|nr:hypothetical protein [Lentilactobacillus kosonis]GAY74250.1 hypothetical protein NBRC111893_2396 [Lentilactobacillus kosonis]